MSSRRGLLALLAAFAAVLACVPAAFAAGGKILFGAMPADYSQRMEIYGIDPDGANLVRYTNNCTDDFAPAASPDGSRIAYTANRADGRSQVWVMNADGSDQHRLVDNGSGADWSPDGTQLVYANYNPDTGEYSLWIVNADGTGAHAIPAALPRVVSFPAWSPDGTTIAFQGSGSDLWTVHPDGSELHQVDTGGLNAAIPEWSQTGKILSTINTDAATIAPDGSDFAYVGNFIWGIGFRYSPDDSQIVYASQGDPLNYFPSYHLYVMNADGTGSRDIFGDDNTGMSWPTWANTTVDPPTTDHVDCTPPADPVANTSPPAIDGASAPGSTLTGTDGEWSGGPTRFEREWLRCDATGYDCAVVSGADSYVVGDDDVEHTIRLRVFATDGRTYATAMSWPRLIPGATQAPVANTTPPAIDGATDPGGTLTGTDGEWSGDPTSFEREWLRCDANGDGCAVVSTADSYELGAGDARHTIRLRVTASNDANSDSATSSPTTIPGVPVNTVRPKVSGAAQTGRTLTASPGTWSDSPTSYDTRWERCDAAGGHCVVITAAGDANDGDTTYTLTGADSGHSLRALVQARNAWGSGTPAASPQTRGVDVPVNTTLPSVSGVPQPGRTLTAAKGSWSNTPTNYTYTWERCGGFLSRSCVAVTGADATDGDSTYTLTDDDRGHTVRVIVEAANAAGSAKATSGQTTMIGAPANTVRPAIRGTIQPGQTLTTTNGTWIGDPTAYYVNWQRCDLTGANCEVIQSDDAVDNDTTYTLTEDDRGHTIRGMVEADNDFGWALVTSVQTGAVGTPVNTALPRITGTPLPGQTLTADSGTWNGTPSGYVYSWQRCNTAGSGCATITGTDATDRDNTYTLTDADRGHTIHVLVDATNVAGKTRATSLATQTIGAPVNTVRPRLLGTTSAGRTITLTTGTWSPAPTGYALSWQRCDSAGAHCQPLTTADATDGDASYTLGPDDVGKRLRGYVEATNDDGSAGMFTILTLAVT